METPVEGYSHPVMIMAAKHSTWQHGRTGFRWGEWMRCLQGWGSSAAGLCEAERSMLPRQANPKHEALQTLKRGPLRITATTLYVPLTTLEAHKARLTFVLESLRICCFQLCLVTNMSASSTGQGRVAGFRHTSRWVLLAAATAEAACCCSTSCRAFSCCSCMVLATA